MRLFLDANVIFSAAYGSQGRSAALFRLAERGFCTLMSSPHALEEARRNLAAKTKTGATILATLRPTIRVVEEAEPSLLAWALKLGLPEKDAPILAAAVAARADLLVTGDKRHFGHLFGKRPGGIGVVPPVDALAEVLADPME